MLLNRKLSVRFTNWQNNVILTTTRTQKPIRSSTLLESYLNHKFSAYEHMLNNQQINQQNQSRNKQSDPSFSE